MRKLILVLLALGMVFVGMCIGGCKKDKKVTAGSSGSSGPGGALLAPANLVATAISATQISLAWIDSIYNLKDGFKIERKSGANGTYVEAAMLLWADPNTISFEYQDQGLVSGTTYYYRIKAFKNDGNSGGYSNEAFATTFGLSPLTLPIAPSGLSVTVAPASQADISWIDNSDNEEKFVVEVKIGEHGTYVLLVATSPNVISCIHAGLSPATTYYYRVKASNSVGDSEYSNEALVTTANLLGAPNAPSVLTTTSVTRTQINLSWTDNSTDEIGFVVEWRIGAINWMELVTTGSDITSCAQGGLTANTTYYYRVRAYNATGNSAYSNELSVTTPSQ